MEDLIAWLRALLDTAEQAMREGVHPGQPHTESVELDPNGEGYGEYSECERCQEGFREYRQRNPYANEAFGLADIEAKRLILDQHNDPRSDGRTLRPGGAQTVCGTCHEFGNRYEHQPWPCATLRALALPYAGWPGYRPEWAPETD